MVNDVLCGDCFELLDKIEPRSVDLILSDPPYGKTQNEYDEKEIDTVELFKQYNRVVKETGVIVLTCAEPFTSMLVMANKKKYKYKYIWVKSKATNFLNAKKQPLRKFEEVVVFYGKQPTYNPRMTVAEPYDKGVRKNQLTGSYGDFDPVHVKSGSGIRYPTDVLYFKTAESEIERTVWHPNQKPIALMEYFISTYTNPGELVLDTFVGAGTTACACVLTGRNFICMDNQQKWVDVTNQRVEFWRQEVNRQMYYSMDRQSLPGYS